MQHPDRIALSLCGIVIQHRAGTILGSNRCNCATCRSLYNNGMKAVKRNGDPTAERSMRLKEYAEDRKGVLYADIANNSTKTFVRLSDIYALRSGRVYNTMKQTYPTITEIESDMIKHRYGGK